MMTKKINLTILMFIGLFMSFLCFDVRAQDPNVSQDIDISQPPPPRPNLLRELNLSLRQVQQMRRLNQERRPMIQESQRRLRQANDALDQAIYADSNNEAEIETRIKEVHAAQMDVIRNRTMMELAIRRILTPEQLVRFRDLRGQFAQQNKPVNRAQPRQDKLRNLPRGLRPKALRNNQPPRPLQ